MNYPISVKQEDNGDVFVETFLISAVDMNNKGWKVSHDNPDDFDKRVLASKHHPLTLYQTEYKGNKIWDHPIAPRVSGESASTIKDDIEFQKKYTIGYATHFKKIDDGIWNTTYKIVSEGAKKFFTEIKEKGIKLFTSPYIVKVGQNRDNIKEWALIHNAIVSNPANKQDLAAVKEICQGSESSCSSLFASMTSEDSLPDCGYCIEQSLRDYVTSHSLLPENNLSIMSEIASNVNTATTQNNVASNVNGEVGNNVNTTATPSVVENKTSNLPINHNQEPKQSQSSVGENKDEQISKLQAQIESMSKQMEIDKRTSQVKEILKEIAPVVYVDSKTGGIDQERFNSELDSLVKKNYSIEDIQELANARFINARSLISNSKNTLAASMTTQDFDQVITSQVAPTQKSIPYTKMNGNGISTESASNNNSNSFVELENAVISRALSEHLVSNSKVLSHYKNKFGGLV